jgi:hypothetical protein
MSFDVHKTDPYTCYVSAFDVLRVTEESLICIKLQSAIWLKLKLIYNRQSVGQSILVSGAHLGPVTNFSFSMKFCSALSDERTGP